MIRHMMESDFGLVWVTSCHKLWSKKSSESRRKASKEDKDEEDVEIPDMVTARSSEWKEMKRTMQDTVDRLAQSRARIREH